MIRRTALALLMTAAGAFAQPATTTSASRPATAPASQPATQPAVWTDVKPTLLKLEVNADNPVEAGAQLSRQLGMPVSIANQNSPVRYSGEEKPYAAALGEFLEKAGLSPVESGSGLALMAGKPLRVSAMNDVCTLVISRITANASRSYLNPQQQPNYSYGLQGIVILDPALKVLSVSQTATIDKAELTPAGFRPNGGGGFDSYAVYRALSDQTPSLRLNFNFSTAKPVTKINLLGGRLKAWRVVDEASVDVAFDQIADGLPVEGKGVTATVAVDPRAGRQGALTVTLVGPAIELYKDGRWQQGMARTVSATDVDGGRMALNVYSMGRPTPPRPKNGQPAPPAEDKPASVTLTVRGDMRNGMQASEFFDLLTALHVRVPTKLKAVELPFEIRDIDLVPEQK